MVRFWETVVGTLLACAAMALVPAVASCSAGSTEVGPVGAEVGEAASEEIICVGDSCQPLPPEPEDPTPSTLVPNPGNPPLRFFEPRKHGKKHRKRGQKKHRRGGVRRAERPTG